MYNIDPFANSTPVANETVAVLDHFEKDSKLLQFSDDLMQSIDEDELKFDL
jgi:hypothetical protein